MSPLLTNRQAEELHKSMIAYLIASGLHDTAATLRRETELAEDVFDATTAKRYEGMLEKKWTSIARLQKKIMDLESRNATLQHELDNSTPASRLRRNQDPATWLPSTTRYSLESHRDKINCVAFHPTFSSIASGSDDCTIKIWDWELGELERTLKGHTRAVRDIDYGGPRDNVLLASCSSDLSIKLWDPADGYKNIRTLQGHDHIVSAVRFIPSGNLLVSASRDTEMRVWDVTNGYCVKTISGHSDWVRDICLSFDGRFLFSVGQDMTARLWDISTVSNIEHKRTMLGHENFIECCALASPATYQFLAPLAGLGKRPPSNDIHFMATGSRDNTIKVWDTRGTCLMTLVGHDSWVQAVVFHPGGKYLLSVSDDKTIRCWDLSQQGKCVKTINAHESFVTCLKWAPGVANIAQDAEGGALDGKGGNKDSSNGTSGDSLANIKIRCVIATGGWDRKLNIFAG
ncbi:Nuclear distribution protein nudF [Aspergillus avenaceus]|uniref:Nuclear distribution protein nudF n=1 Tax=Aspergillus avenaceus TaxID=36643 RepID=A0A5N6TQ77_ASPAV|nr:Nuclear distribution protein nudF [Aspergillus avenaceus]